MTIIVEFEDKDHEALVKFLEVQLIIAQINKNRNRSQRFTADGRFASKALFLVERLLKAVSPHP